MEKLRVREVTNLSKNHSMPRPSLPANLHSYSGDKS